MLPSTWPSDHIERHLAAVDVAAGCTTITAGSRGFAFYGETEAHEQLAILAADGPRAFTLLWERPPVPLSEEEAAALLPKSSMMSWGSDGHFVSGPAEAIVAKRSRAAVRVGPALPAAPPDVATVDLVPSTEGLARALLDDGEALLMCLAEERTERVDAWSGAWTIDAVTANRHGVVTGSTTARAGCWAESLARSVGVASARVAPPWSVEVTVHVPARVGTVERLGADPLVQAGSGLWVQRTGASHEHYTAGGSSGRTTARVCSGFESFSLAGAAIYGELGALGQLTMVREANDRVVTASTTPEPGRVATERQLRDHVDEALRGRGKLVTYSIISAAGVARTGTLALGDGLAFMSVEGTWTGRRVIAGPPRSVGEDSGPGILIDLPAFGAIAAAEGINTYAEALLSCFEADAPPGELAFDLGREKPSGWGVVTQTAGTASSDCWKKALSRAIHDFPASVVGGDWHAAAKVRW